MGSVVGSVKELMERIHYIHEEFDSPALIEEYIEGREMYAAVIGNESPEVLPMVELDLSKLPEEHHDRRRGSSVEKDTERYRVTKSARPDLDEDAVERLSTPRLAAYQALKLRDYGTINLALTRPGRFRHRSQPGGPGSPPAPSLHRRERPQPVCRHDLEIIDLARARYAAAEGVKP